jgi:eukaryotic translation initiation factor 2C
LCYTYVRAPVGVSYASPAYYADRLCERGRCYLRSFLVAPKRTPVRDEFDAFQAKLEKEIKTAREKDFPAATKGGSQQRRKGRQPKEPKLAAREEADKKKLQEKCDEHVMEKAREEFEKYRKGGNPWHPNISKTMFWM